MIKITDEVYKMLEQMGTKSETFSDVILRCIESYKTNVKK
jgi:predicted CopG family antitoxin